MAHGELFMLGGFTLYVMYSALSPYMSSAEIFFLSIPTSFILVGILGFILQTTLFRALSDRPFAILMATLSFGYILQVVVTLCVGQIGRSVPTPIKGFYASDGLILPYQRGVIIGVSLFMVLSLWFLLMKTKLGRSIRAVAQDPRGAVLQGVNLRRVGAVTMILGAGLAAVSGVLIGSVNAVNPFMGAEALWRAFIIIIVGGVGSIPGTLVAALLFALIDTGLLRFGLGHLVVLVDALVMLGVLALRPHGLLGQKD
jgi:branched-subunit amino acid ABC-type transport system permease component